jgi:hypothetical protein
VTAPPILQIVPQLPGTHGGVGDYSLTLAKTLRARYGRETVFISSGNISEASSSQHEHVILHYVNYGYQKRGVPFALLPLLRDLRRGGRGRFLTIFHELYASGPPWQSAFWLRPFQVQIARSISRLSDACIVSSDTSARELQKLTPQVRVRVHPVFSNFGEPSLSQTQTAERDPHRWVICGGTALVERSVRSFCAIVKHIPPAFSPSELFVLGGNDNPAVRSLLSTLTAMHSDYRPQIAAEEAPQILSTCSFSWMDYFHRADVPTDALLKSSAFAAACAHGVIAVLPHPGSSISIGTDALPGPYFVQAHRCQLPPEQDRHKVAAQIYDWYRSHAASQHLAKGIACALDLPEKPAA